MKLVLIESPNKQSSVQKYLGKDYKVLPTFGHLSDLPVKGLGVQIFKNFEPEYVVEGDKKKVVAKLQQEAKKADQILFATDPDREGEAIAWHAANLLNVDYSNPVRIEFNQITEKAVNEAAKNPRPINMDLVNAQQARRVLDRLVGYKLTPLLCKKIQNNLSGGRVQSVTLKLVVDRDREIENFKPQEYWTLVVNLKKNEGKETFKATYNPGKDKKVESKEEMDKILADIEGQTFVATNVKRSISLSHPSAPFSTATMQKDATNKLGMTLKQVTATAQSLYEGVEIEGQGKLALVTYIRTDSVRVSPEAQAMAKEYITNKYGDKYLPKSVKVYKNKKDAQDAHEAIRPISLKVTPESIKDKVQKNIYKLYKLIYDRFLASQMADAEYNALSVELEAGGHKFKTAGKALIFEGYTAVYNNQPDKNEEGEDEVSSKLPNIEANDTFTKKDFKAEQKFTKPPAHYTESSLVDEMESNGIGRPATYAQTVTTLQTRTYVEKQGKLLISTQLGRVVVDLLTKYFSDIMDVKFTADMEDSLDDIEYQGKEWQKVIADFYGGFEKELKTAFLDGEKNKLPDEESDEICDKCGSRMVIKSGKFGKFLACPNFPTCKNTKKMGEESPVVGVCPKCGKDVRKLKTKNGKFFYGCDGYPDCEFKSWDIPANEKCPNCDKDMIMKVYKTKKVISCPKCGFSTSIKIEKVSDEQVEEN